MAGQQYTKFVAGIAADPIKVDQLKTDPMKVLNESAAQADAAYISDKNFYYIAIGVLGLVLLIVVVSVVIFTFFNLTTPQVLVALGSAAIGAIAGLFAPSPVSKQ